MQESFANVNSALGEAALSYWGEGVLKTTTYLDPFPFTMSSMALGGTVGYGIAIDPNGQITRIDPGQDTPSIFTLDAADPVNPRWDLVVMQYRQVGDTQVPKPSDPISSVYLNLHDDFIIYVRKGTPSVTPSYPAKQAGDIILAGIKIPALATLGTQCTVDYSVRELAEQKVFQLPSFVHEIPTGVVNGVNTSFSLSKLPLSGSSVLVMLDGLVLDQTEWSILNQTITLATAPATGQVVDVWYIYVNPISENPLAGFSEVPSGAINGVNDTFVLSGKAGNKDSTLVMVNGLILHPNQWNLIQGDPSDSIQFLSGSIPTTGQTILVFYLVNPLTIGIGVGGGGGTITGGTNIGTGTGIFDSVIANVMRFKKLNAGTNITITDNGFGTVTIAAAAAASPGLAANGTYASPNTVVNAAGVLITGNVREVQWTKSSGGAMLITALPQIQAGTTLGQELVLKGTSDTDYTILQDQSTVPGSGLSLNGTMNLKDHSSIYLVWDGVVWDEISRR